MPVATYPETRAGRTEPRRRHVSLFGLAPSGVCLATGVGRRGAPLPHLFTLTPDGAVYFLWHFPWARAPQVLPGTLPCGARTFLRRAERGKHARSTAITRPTCSTQCVTLTFRFQHLDPHRCRRLLRYKVCSWEDLLAPSPHAPRSFYPFPRVICPLHDSLQ